MNPILEPTTSPNVFKVLIRPGGMVIGVVARMIFGGWCYGCTHDGCGGSESFPSAEAAAVALDAHDLGKVLDRIQAELDSGNFTVAPE